MSAPLSVAVVGAGFSGALLAVQLLRRCAGQDRVYLFERDSRFGRGTAYSTGNPNHLLNVRAENMSAFPDDPDHFRRWLATRGAEEQPAETPAGPFVSRALYGRYVQDLLGSEIWSGGKARHLFLVPDEVVGIAPEPAGSLAVKAAGGRHYAADAAVLALGNFQPGDTVAGHFGNPWDPAALENLPATAPVLLIGTGLTMVDMLVSLLDRRHKGPIIALSRRGFLPFSHEARQAWRPLLPSAAERGSVRAMFRLLRREIEAAAEAGVDWRAVVDAVRPLTQSVWQGWSLVERRRFLRHVRALWDVHRHRMAPSVAAQVAAALARGQLIVRRGWLRGIEPVAEGEGLAVTFRPKGAAAPETLTVARVINCSGPASDYTRIDAPLIQDLLGQGLARPDPLRLGLDVDADGALIDREGTSSPRLFAVGPVTKGNFWEITAVPDIRTQCAQLAARIMDRRDLPVSDLVA